MIHLDSNLVIALADASHPHREAAISVAKSGTSLAVSSLAWWEFECGPIAQGGIQLVRLAIQDQIIPFTSAHSAEAARLFNAVGRARRFKFDSLIAATAILAGAPLATANTTDFQAFVPHGLQLHKW